MLIVDLKIMDSQLTISVMQCPKKIQNKETMGRVETFFQAMTQYEPEELLDFSQSAGTLDSWEVVVEGVETTKKESMALSELELIGFAGKLVRNKDFAKDSVGGLCLGLFAHPTRSL